MLKKNNDKFIWCLDLVKLVGMIIWYERDLNEKLNLFNGLYILKGD